MRSKATFRISSASGSGRIAVADGTGQALPRLLFDVEAPAARDQLSEAPREDSSVGDQGTISNPVTTAAERAAEIDKQLETLRAAIAKLIPELPAKDAKKVRKTSRSSRSRRSPQSEEKMVRGQRGRVGRRSKGRLRNDGADLGERFGDCEGAGVRLTNRPHPASP